MSRYKDIDLAYGDIPQRWDRERFERIGSRGSGPRFEEDFRYEERDRPGRRDVMVADHIERRESRGRFEESDRFFDEQEARARAASRRRRRTDKELFGDIDPREVADLALAPYVPPPRPGIIRRQSSLDTFDRRTSRRGEQEYRIPAYTPVPLPVRRRHHHHHHRHHDDHWDEPEDYREVEIRRERSVHRRRGPKSRREESKAPSSSSSSSSSSATESIPPPPPKSRATSRAPSTKPHEVVQETAVEKVPTPPPAPSVKSSSLEASIREERRFKKGKTRMPKRLVRLEAIMDLGYPFDEEEDFFVLRIALEKEQIDEVIHISETYKDGEKKKIYRFEKTVEEEVVPAPPIGEREEIERTEWINPPTIIGARSRAKSLRDASPSAKSSISRRDSPRTRRPSSPRTYVEKTTFEEVRTPPPPPPPQAPEIYEREERIIEERVPASHHLHHHDHHGGALVVQEREWRSDRDINAEIRALEIERRALRFEREAEQKRDMAIRLRERRSADDLQLVEYRRPAREELVLYEREREKSPPRNVIRVEKDRKARKQKKLFGAAVATLL